MSENYRDVVQQKELIDRQISETRDEGIDPLWLPYIPVGNSMSGLFIQPKENRTRKP